MLPLIEQHRQEIESLCRKYGIKRLDLFGSAANGEFNPSTSDLDFFYEFNDDKSHLADRFFGLLGDLQSLFNMRIDLVSAKHATNPYFLELANRNRITLYAA